MADLMYYRCCSNTPNLGLPCAKNVFPPVAHLSLIHISLTKKIGMFSSCSLFRTEPLKSSRFMICLVFDTNLHSVKKK